MNEYLIKQCVEALESPLAFAATYFKHIPLSEDECRQLHELVDAPDGFIDERITPIAYLIYVVWRLFGFDDQTHVIMIQNSDRRALFVKEIQNLLSSLPGYLYTLVSYTSSKSEFRCTNRARLLIWPSTTDRLRGTTISSLAAFQISTFPAFDQEQLLQYFGIFNFKGRRFAYLGDD